MAKGRKSNGDAAVSTPKKSASREPSIQLANGFLAVPLSISSKHLGEIKHWIYVRKHSSPASNVASTSKLSEELPAERTLFVANLPVDATEAHLREVFAKAATISSIKWRRAATVKEEEEDEREERGEGEDDVEQSEDGEGDQDEEEHHQLALGGKGKKGKKGKNVKKSRVPKVVPLPSLDPREEMGSQGFLSTASSAHVVFLDVSGFSKAIEMLKTGIRWSDPFRSLRSSSTTTSSSRPTTSSEFLQTHGASAPPSGLSYLLSAYHLARPSLPSIAEHANSRISLYQYRKAHPLPRRIGVRGVTVGPSGELLDEDGFIIVQRSSGSGKYGRAGAAADAGGSVGVARHDFKENTKKKSEGLEDFYRFQFRERKREQLADLRAKFEMDKQKVAKLKAGRRFKPY